MIRRLFVSFAFLLTALLMNAGTLAIFETSVGTMNLELYDADKPETVANFIRYVRSGRYTNMFVQRWEPRFVIQGGGYYVEGRGTTNATFRPIPTFPNITNEFSVGTEYSNTYGTIAMARRPGETNSASSQWFLNMTNNAFLDDVDGGFTVFGKVFSGTQVLDKFHPPPPVNGIYRTAVEGYNKYDEPIFMETLPVLDTTPTPDDLVYVNVKFVECKIRIAIRGRRDIAWNSIAGITNRVQVSTNIPAIWTTFADVLGTGNEMTVSDTSPQTNSHLYRVQLLFN